MASLEQLQTDIENLEATIRSLETGSNAAIASVSAPGGRSDTYRSLPELRDSLARMKAELAVRSGGIRPVNIRPRKPIA